MANKGEVALGDEVKDTITGFSGVVVAITQWLNGCERITIQPRTLKDGRPTDVDTIDVEQVQITKKTQRVAAAASGGPYPKPSRPSDPGRG